VHYIFKSGGSSLRGWKMLLPRACFGQGKHWTRSSVCFCLGSIDCCKMLLPRVSLRSGETLDLMLCVWDWMVTRTSGLLLHLHWHHHHHRHHKISFIFGRKLWFIIGRKLWFIIGRKWRAIPANVTGNWFKQSPAPFRSSIGEPGLCA